MSMGYTMRQQAIAATYAKVLRLNSSSIADISAGKVRYQMLPLSSQTDHKMSCRVLVQMQQGGHSASVVQLLQHGFLTAGLHALQEACLPCLQITNLVSNDVRRFDEAITFWCFLWGGDPVIAPSLACLQL